MIRRDTDRLPVYQVGRGLDDARLPWGASKRQSDVSAGDACHRPERDPTVVARSAAAEGIYDLLSGLEERPSQGRVRGRDLRSHLVMEGLHLVDARAKVTAVAAGGGGRSEERRVGQE